MLPEDENRLQRDRDVARAIAPGDYTKLVESIRKAKAEHATRMESSMRKYAEERSGYYALAGQGNVPRTDYGATPTLRPPPALGSAISEVQCGYAEGCCQLGR